MQPMKQMGNEDQGGHIVRLKGVFMAETGADVIMRSIQCCYVNSFQFYSIVIINSYGKHITNYLNNVKKTLKNSNTI